MELFKAFATLVLDTSQFEDKIRGASGTFKSLGSTITSGVGNIAKVMRTGLVDGATAGATAIRTITKSAAENFAEYEQLVGGAELMFGNAYATVAENAKQAYATVQMSQNEYLQQVNGFATGLKTALGGNEQAAAELAHRIIEAEANVVAATGNSAEAVQNAFNGIMKSNFTINNLMSVA